MNARVDTVDPPSLLMKSLRREHGFEPLRVEGTLPTELRGTLYRVGPGLFEAQGKRYGHPFEGDGAVCGVRFENGRASGAHRVVQSAGLIAERRAGAPLYGSVASWPRRASNAWRLRAKNSANTNLMMWQDKLFALYEVSRPTRLSSDLETLGESDLDGAVLSACSAHPHRVEAHGAIYNFGVRYGLTTFLDLYRLPDRGAAERIASLPLHGPVMLHDFIATERHLVFFVSPSIVQIGRAFLGLNPFEKLVGWEPERGTEVIVVPLDDPQHPIRFEVDAFYQWHFANAFEQGDDVVVDFVRYPDLGTLDELADDVNDIEGGRLSRARIDRRFRQLRVEPLDDGGCEFPRIDPRVCGARHRRVWVSSSQGIHQHDLEDGTKQAHAFPDGFASEPVFVPRAVDAPEGDGWVLALVYDEATATSHVSILDTARFAEAPVAKVWFDHHVPVTFHGIWTDRIS